MLLALFFATNLRQSRAFRMQFIVSAWGLRPHTPSRGFAPAPYEGALRRPPRPPACFRYFRHQLKSSLIDTVDGYHDQNQNARGVANVAETKVKGRLPPKALLKEIAEEF